MIFTFAIIRVGQKIRRIDVKQYIQSKDDKIAILGGHRVGRIS